MNIRFSLVILAIIVVFMSIFARIFTRSSALYSTKSTKKLLSTMSASVATAAANSTHLTFKRSDPLPVYFFSHGGPTFYDRGDSFSDKGAWDKTKEVGTLIKETIKPDFVIVVSAHWQSDSNTSVEVSMPSTRSPLPFRSSTTSKPFLESGENDLIYDFYGFPPHHYKNQFHTKGDAELSKDIVRTLKENGLSAKTTERGIDHGVWVPLRIAFGETTIPDTHKLDLDVPLVQVSLTYSSEMDIHYKLGQALGKYRTLNGMLICSGMSVHNLRDLGRSMQMGGRTMPYAEPFNKVLSNVLKGDEGDALGRLKQIEENDTWRRLYVSSHPTNEHFLPVVVGAGAALGDSCVEEYSSASSSLGWNIYRWGQYNRPAKL